MAEPVTITLASVKVFLAFVNSIKTVVTTVNLARNYATDLDDVVLQLEILAISVQILVEQRWVLRDDLVTDGAHYTTINHTLVLMKAHFEYCAKILKWYRHENRTQSCPDEILSGDLTPENFSAEKEPVAPGRSTTIPQSDSTELTETAPSNADVQRPQQASKQKKKGWRNPLTLLKPKPRDKAKDKQPKRDTELFVAATSAIDNLGIEQTGSDIEDGISEYRKHTFRRAPWVIYDKDRLEGRVVKIRNLYRDLDTLLKRLTQKHGQWVFPQSPEVATMWPHITRVSKCLKLLQDAMVSVNYGGDKEFFLSLRLREDHNQSRIEMQNVRGAASFSVSHDADVFFFRRHFSEILDDDAHTFIVECRPEKNQNLIDTESDLSELERLDIPPAVEQIQVCRNIERWGSLAKNDSRARFTNIVYYQSNTVQKSDLTLIDMISNSDFLEKMRPEHTARLARLIFYSHLYLQEVLQGQDQPKPRNYVYYHARKELWDPTQPLILSPWLSIGFGSRRDDDDLGEGPGVLPSRNFLIAELGLMLWQLGTGQLLDYDRDIGTLIDKAMSDARLLSQRMGLLYTELTQTCLRHVGPPPHLASPEEMAQENMVIKNCISTLAALDSAMSGTVSKSVLALEREVGENTRVSAEAQPKDQQSLQEATPSNEQHLDEHYFEGIGSIHMVAPSIKVTVPTSGNEVTPQQISAPLLYQMTANSARANTNIARSAPSVEASEISLSDTGPFTDIPATPMTDLENSSLQQANLDRLSNLPAPKTEIIMPKQDLRIVGEDENEAELAEAGPSYRTPMAC